MVCVHVCVCVCVCVFFFHSLMQQKLLKQSNWHQNCFLLMKLCTKRNGRGDVWIPLCSKNFKKKKDKKLSLLKEGSNVVCSMPCDQTWTLLTRTLQVTCVSCSRGLQPVCDPAYCCISAAFELILSSGVWKLWLCVMYQGKKKTSFQLCMYH